MTGPTPVERQSLQDFIKSGKDFDVRHYCRVVMRHRWLIGFTIGVSLMASAAWVWRQPKKYGSRIVIQVEQQEPKILGKVEELQPKDLSSDGALNTAVEALTGDTLLLRVAKDVGLDRDVRVFPPRPGRTAYSDADVVKEVHRRIRASLRHATRLIDVSVEDEYPERAQRMAESLFRNFLRQNFEQQVAVASAAARFLQEQADQIQRDKVERTERELQEYREAHQAVSLDQNQNIVADKLRDLSSKVTAAKDARIRLATDLDQLNRVRPGDVTATLEIPSVAAIPQVAHLRAQIVAAQTEFQALQTRYGRNHPKYIQAVTTLQGLQESLRRTLADAGNVLATRYAEAKANESQLTAAFHDQETEALNLSKIAIPYNVLQRNLVAERALYNSLVTRIGETNITGGIEKSPLRLVDGPTISWEPVKPEKGKMVLIALIFSLILSAAIVIALDSLDDTLRSVDHAEEFLGARALAVIPEDKRGATQPLVVVDDPKSRQAEAFRGIRASVSLLEPEEARKVFIVTSALPAEGKTFTAINMAACFAVKGLSTVLLEADLRCPTLHRAFKEEIADREMPGLSDLLTGEAPLDDVLVPSRVPDLTLLFAGRKTSNPGELLTSESFRALTDTLLQRFERVVIDTPPLMAVSDTFGLIARNQYVCLVVRPEKTPKKAVARSLHLIHQAGGKTAGFILNRVSFSIAAGRFYYYYGSKYSRPGISIFPVRHFEKTSRNGANLTPTPLRDRK
jgi:polysaccharide biosynthesis transport protein